MHSNRQYLRFIFRTIFQLAMIALVIGIVPARAQNTVLRKDVPATARQATTMPAFAPRLARAREQAAARSTSRTRQDKLAGCSQVRGGLPQDNQILYDNGPVNGNVDAWTVNFGFSVTDSVQGNNQILGIQFYAWLIPGDTISNVQVQIGTAAFGNELFDGFVTLTQSNCTGNSYGYNVCLETGSFTGPTINGTAWVTLQNANVPSGDPVYWDENSGVGCTSAGCPSQAQQNTLGTIPSEAFSVNGTPGGPPSCFRDNIIHDFTASEGTPFGVAIDKSSNLYGVSTGGDYGAGMVYRMAQRGEDWLFTPLYSFRGGDNGSRPSSVIVGPDGALYGTANGGLKNCDGGASYCGLVFRLRPPATACASVFCGWQEDVIYAFTGGSHGSSPGNLAFDSAGNLYGIAAGLLFKLAPSHGEWTETVLYTFTDGYVNSLVVGNDGNFYGIESPWIFQLVPSAGGWTLNTLYTFQGTEYDGANPENLHQDRFGTLNGTSYHFNCDGGGHGILFQLTPSNGGWSFDAWPVNQGLSRTDIDDFTEDDSGSIFVIFTYWQRQLDWVYQWTEIEYGANWRTSDWFDPGGPLAVDAGHLYGTTPDCGRYGSGTLWSVRR